MVTRYSRQSATIDLPCPLSPQRQNFFDLQKAGAGQLRVQFILKHMYPHYLNLHENTLYSVS